MQYNWIGCSEGVRIRFRVESKGDDPVEQIEVFTTKPQTLFGVSFLCVSVDSPHVKSLTTPENLSVSFIIVFIICLCI
jgi:leucyl-tRNA synthetase